MLRKGSWCEVDLEQFRINLRALKSIAGTNALLVVKANAYGHGLSQELIQAADSSGMAMYGVATLDEAQQVTDTATKTPILLLSPLLPEEIDICVQRGWGFFVGSTEQLEHAVRTARQLNKHPYMHIKIDTGMGRNGVQPTQLESFFEVCKRCSDFQFEGFATHFASADVENSSTTSRQLEIFERALSLAGEFGIVPTFIHAANSPATLRFPNTRFNLVRLGIAAYGLKPDTWMSLPENVRPVMSWKTRVARIQLLPEGHGISYGSEYITTKSELVATLPLGYVDGFRRVTKANTVLYQGHELPVRGRVCMDQIVVGIPDSLASVIKIGDEVILLGTSVDKEITADDLGSKWNTNNYDAVSGIKERVPRVYLNTKD